MAVRRAGLIGAGIAASLAVAGGFVVTTDLIPRDCGVGARYPERAVSGLVREVMKPDHGNAERYFACDDPDAAAHAAELHAVLVEHGDEPEIQQTAREGDTHVYGLFGGGRKVYVITVTSDPALVVDMSGP